MLAADDLTGPSKQYPLHRFVFEDDLAGVETCLKEASSNVNELDLHENSPLSLALMLDRRNIALALIDAGADCFSRSVHGWTPLEEAVALGDVKLIERLVIESGQQEAFSWCKPGGLLDQWNKTLPNCYMQFFCKTVSPVPFLAKLCPSETYHIYKKGSKLRVDFGVVGLDRRTIPKFLKGSMSLVIRADECTAGALPKIYLMNNVEKTYQELFPNLPSWSLKKTVNSYYLATSSMSHILHASSFRTKKKSGGMFGNKKAVGGKYKAELWKIKNASFEMVERQDVLIGCKDSEHVVKKYRERWFGKIKRGKTGSNNSQSTNGSEQRASGGNAILNLKRSPSTIGRKNGFVPISDRERLEEKIHNMLTTGHDENGNVLTEEDLESLNRDLEAMFDDAGSIRSIKTHSSIGSVDGSVTPEDVDVPSPCSKASKRTRSPAHAAAESAARPNMTAEEYFAGNPSRPVHVGRYVEVQKEVFRYAHSAKLWMSDGVGVTLSQFAPVLEYVLGKVGVGSNEPCKEALKNKKTADAREITRELVEDKLPGVTTFPVKIELPIFATVSAKIKLLECDTKPDRCADSMFVVPSDYQPGEVSFRVY